MRRDNLQTKEIIEKLMARGLSEATAFRRLRLAESPRGADMILKHRDGSKMVMDIKTKSRSDSQLDDVARDGSHTDPWSHPHAVATNPEE
jgi:hypothetical protein